MTQKQFHDKVGKLAQKFNGKSNNCVDTETWKVETPKHGTVSITPINDWVALRFDTFSTGKPYDTLFGRDFNGYSGKWNVLIGGASKVSVRNAVLLELEWRLEQLKGA